MADVYVLLFVEQGFLICLCLKFEIHHTVCAVSHTPLKSYAFGVIVWELFMEVNDDAERILMSSAQ